MDLMHNVIQNCKLSCKCKTNRAYGYLMHLHWTRLKSIWEVCNRKDSRLDGLAWSSQLAQCHVGEYVVNPYVGVSRTKVMARKSGNIRHTAGYTGLIQCCNSLCPLCGPRLMAMRCQEIRRAVHAHLNRCEPSALFMLTFTLRHKQGDGLRWLRDGLSNAMEAFARNGTVKRIFQNAGRVGRIRSFECQYSRLNGYHPHSHNLYFVSRLLTEAEVSRLQTAWVCCCSAVGMDSTFEVGLNYRPCDTGASDYLTKISGEIALGNVSKLKGEKNGHYNPMQLLQLAADGEKWAKDVYIDEVLAFRGMHILNWSKGLKRLYGIDDVTDDEAVAQFDKEKETLARISRCDYQSLPWRIRGEVLDIVSQCGISESHLWLRRY